VTTTGERKGKATLPTLLVTPHTSHPSQSGAGRLTPCLSHLAPALSFTSALLLAAALPHPQTNKIHVFLLCSETQSVMLSHVSISHRTQHEGYTEVCIKIPFFCKNETFFTRQLNLCHPF